MQRCHEQCQRLPLTAGQKLDLGGKTILQAEIQPPQLLFEHLAFLLSDAPSQAALLPAAQRKRKVLFDPHVTGSSHHGILEHAAKQLCPAVLRHMRHVLSIDPDLAGSGRIRAAHAVQQR